MDSQLNQYLFINQNLKMKENSLPSILPQLYNKVSISYEQANLEHEKKISSQQFFSNTLVDRCFGCLFGAFIGDSIGSFCQFEGYQSDSRIKLAMTMPGGGPFYLQPGQITDDSEMAMHLLNGLLNYDPNVQLKQQIDYLQYCIAQEYIKWLLSNPFDIGITCQRAILHLKKHISLQKISLYQFKKNEAKNIENLQKSLSLIKKDNQQSLSNGFLMRIWPLAIFHALLMHQKQNPKQNQLFLSELIKKQVSLTHSNQIAIDAALEFVEMLSSIMRTDLFKGQNQQLKQLNLYDPIFQQFLNKNCYPESIKKEILNEIQQRDPIRCTQKIGYFKHAYHFLIYEIKGFLRMKEQKSHNVSQLNSQYFKNSISFVVRQGGDTDTNGCIIGGFMGAVLGFNRLPRQYLQKQLNLNLGKNRGKYGKFYEPRSGFANLIRLIKKIKI